jgi:hypothetical protein
MPVAAMSAVAMPLTWAAVLPLMFMISSAVAIISMVIWVAVVVTIVVIRWENERWASGQEYS